MYTPSTSLCCTHTETNIPQTYKLKCTLMVHLTSSPHYKKLLLLHMLGRCPCSCLSFDADESGRWCLLFRETGSIRAKSLNDWWASHYYINSYLHFLWKVEQPHKTISAVPNIRFSAGQHSPLLFRPFFFFLRNGPSPSAAGLHLQCTSHAALPAAYSALHD